MKLLLHPSARMLLAYFCLALAAASPSSGQGHGGGPAGGGGMGSRPAGGGGMRNQLPGGPRDAGMGGLPNQPRPRNQSPEGRAGLQLGPPGRWWDDQGFAKNLKLRPEQQSRMDGIFEQNRNSLITSYHNLQEAESQLQELSRSSLADESALFAQINRVAQARAELEKATTHMFLQLRREMDPDQLKRLEKTSR